MNDDVDFPRLYTDRDEAEVDRRFFEQRYVSRIVIVPMPDGRFGLAYA